MVTEEILESAEQAWNDLLDDYNFPTNAARHEAFDFLITAYSDPNRHYHDLEHIYKMLLDLEVCGERPSRLETWLATWYHDVVYDPRRLDNEEQSAEVARRALGVLRINHVTIDRTAALIMMTKKHQAPDGDTDAHLFIDADLSILGADPSAYSNYSAAIRKEYSLVPDRDYYLGRRGVLQRFLARPAIYSTAWHKNKFEEAARANIAAEIAQIDAILRTLPP